MNAVQRAVHAVQRRGADPRRGEARGLGKASAAPESRTLHVAFFNRSFYPEMAATGQLLTELAEDLVAKHGCRVSVVTGVPLLSVKGNRPPSRSPGIVTRETYRGIEILRSRGTRFSKRRFAGRFANYVTYFFSACYAGQRLDRPDVVVGLTDPPIIGLAAWLAARRFRVPLVMSYRDIYPELARLLEDFESRTVERVLLAVNRFLVAKADRVIALGETMRKRLIEGKGADPAKTVVIPDWADCEAIKPGPKSNPFSRAHGLDDKFVVMHSGNIGLSQGLEVMVDAAARLQHIPEIQFVFVGDGVKRPALEKRVRDLGLSNVRFLPFQPKERLTESFATADVFIISLKRDLAGYIVPSKLYGILAAGRPYVAAVEKECEITGITNEWECGLVAGPTDPDKIADQILRLYRDPGLRSRLATNARSAARQAFDRCVHVNAYGELLRSVAAPTGGNACQLDAAAQG